MNNSFPVGDYKAGIKYDIFGIYNIYVYRFAVICTYLSALIASENYTNAMFRGRKPKQCQIFRSAEFNTLFMQTH